MPRYDTLWSILVESAMARGGIDAEAFVARAVATGATEEQVITMLMDDLDNDGPLFGAFLKSLNGAAQSATAAAVRQGELVGHLEADDEMRRLIALADAEDALDEALRTADPELSEQLEALTQDDLRETSVAELVNTCHRCLPLHGKTMTRREWRELGLLPENRHAGWSSACKCRLVPAAYTEESEDLVAPLIRERVESPRGLKPSRRTARMLSEKSIERALAERDRAMQSPEGRRTLRLLGKLESLG